MSLPSLPLFRPPFGICALLFITTPAHLHSETLTSRNPNYNEVHVSAPEAYVVYDSPQKSPFQLNSLWAVPILQTVTYGDSAGWWWHIVKEEPAYLKEFGAMVDFGNGKSPPTMTTYFATDAKYFDGTPHGVDFITSPTIGIIQVTFKDLSIQGSDEDIRVKGGDGNASLTQRSARLEANSQFKAHAVVLPENLRNKDTLISFHYVQNVRISNLADYQRPVTYDNGTFTGESQTTGGNYYLDTSEAAYDSSTTTKWDNATAEVTASDYPQYTLTSPDDNIFTYLSFMRLNERFRAFIRVKIGSAQVKTIGRAEYDVIGLAQLQKVRPGVSNNFRQYYLSQWG